MVRALLIAAIALLAVAPAPRTVIYEYTYESGTSAEAQKAYGVDKMDPGGGGTFYFHNVNQHYRSPAFDAAERRSGRIGIQIVREEADGGLVLSVDEPLAGRAADASAGVACVVFGDTTVVCDPNRPLSPEASAIVALLGNDFVDASRLDAARHWRVATAGTYVTAADFTVNRTTGSTLTIAESAVRMQPGSAGKTQIAASIVYDAARSLPVSVDESTLQQVQRAGVVSETISSHTTLTLSPR